jgi:predicted nucleotidyltransferase
MSPIGLSPRHLEAIRSVLAAHPEVARVLLFGSRAKGTHHPASDIDLAVTGHLDVRGIEMLALELDELPLPFRFDVTLLESIRNPSLTDHIRRVGVSIYEREDQ